MKILGIILAILGLIGVLYSLYNWIQIAAVSSQISNSSNALATELLQQTLNKSIVIVVIVSFLSLMFLLIGILLFRKGNSKDTFIKALENLTPHLKKGNENFNLRIENIKRWTGNAYYAIGIKINDEDKGVIENGDNNSFTLPDGPNKIVLTSFVTKKQKEIHPATVLTFSKDTVLDIKLRFTNSGVLEFID